MAQELKVPPPQRQHSLQSPVWAHWQHAIWRGSVPVQHSGHEVVTPSQVTDPAWSGQAASVAEQLLALMLLEQETVVYWQFAVALQRDFPVRTAGRLAAWRTPLGCKAQEPAAGRPRIAARASWVREGWLGGT